MPPGQLPAGREIRHFSIDGRFSLRQGERSGSGRIAWTHGPGTDLVLIQDPFGNGLAEIDRRPQLATVRMADGSSAADADADALMLRLTGLPLPVAGVGDWLSGRVPDASLTSSTVREADGLGRTRKLEHDGWQIRYEYAEELAEALPARIFATRRDALELRLSIDRWTTTP